jgi:hypothetical protein
MRHHSSEAEGILFFDLHFNLEFRRRIVGSPFAVNAESEEHPQSLQVLLSRERCILPGRAELGSCIEGQLLNVPIAFMSGVGMQTIR